MTSGTLLWVALFNLLIHGNSLRQKDAQSARDVPNVVRSFTWNMENTSLCLIKMNFNANSVDISEETWTEQIRCINRLELSALRKLNLEEVHLTKLLLVKVFKENNQGRTLADIHELMQHCLPPSERRMSLGFTAKCESADVSNKKNRLRNQMVNAVGNKGNKIRCMVLEHTFLNMDKIDDQKWTKLVDCLSKVDPSGLHEIELLKDLTIRRYTAELAATEWNEKLIESKYNRFNSCLKGNVRGTGNYEKINCQTTKKISNAVLTAIGLGVVALAIILAASFIILYRKIKLAAHKSDGILLMDNAEYNIGKQNTQF